MDGHEQIGGLLYELSFHTKFYFRGVHQHITQVTARLLEDIIHKWEVINQGVITKVTNRIMGTIPKVEQGDTLHKEGVIHHSREEATHHNMGATPINKMPLGLLHLESMQFFGAGFRLVDLKYWHYLCITNYNWDFTEKAGKTM